jgi:hypothetical protein
MILLKNKYEKTLHYRVGARRNVVMQVVSADKTIQV